MSDLRSPCAGTGRIALAIALAVVLDVEGLPGALPRSAWAFAPPARTTPAETGGAGATGNTSIAPEPSVGRGGAGGRPDDASALPTPSAPALPPQAGAGGASEAAREENRVHSPGQGAEPGLPAPSSVPRPPPPPAPAAGPGAAVPRPPPPAPQFPLALLVLERGSRRPLAATAIAVDATPAGETDADGRLTLSLPQGSHDLVAQLPAHAILRIRLDVAEGHDTQLILRLDPDTGGERYQSDVRSKRTGSPRVTVDAEEARQTAGTSGDPLRVLASLPGVSQVVWPAALFVVRGSNPGNTGFFIDGIRVPAAFHLALGPSIVAPNLIAGLDFFPGAYPENFGRYISGIVAIRTERPPIDRVHVAADASLYESRGIVTVPFDDGRGMVAAAGRYSYTGPLLSLFDQNTVVNYRDYQLRIDHTLGPGRLTVFAFGSLDRLDWTGPGLISGSATQTARLQFHRLDVRWAGGLAGGRFIAGVTGGYDLANSTLSQALLSVKAFDLAPRLMWTRPLGRAFELDLGADGEYQHFSAQPDPTHALGDLAKSRPALSQGTFAAVRFSPNDRLSIGPGVRADMFAEEGTSRFVLEPRLDAHLLLLPRLTLKANLGRFSQMPSLPVNVAGFESFGLKSIGLQRSDSVSGGASVRLPDDSTVDVTGFYQRMRVTDLTEPDTSLSLTGPDYLVLHDGLGYGVETLIRRPATHRFSGWISYTLSRSIRNGTNGVVRSDWDQRHILNLVMSYRLGARTTLGARFHYNSGREAALPPPPRVGRVELPDYYQIDLRAERRFVFDRFIMDLFADFANATVNTQLVEYVATSRGPRPSQLRVALPTIGVHGEF